MTPVPGGVATAPARKVTASLYVTLDGAFEAPEQWHFPYHNEEFDALESEAEASDAMLLGPIRSSRGSGPSRGATSPWLTT